MAHNLFPPHTYTARRDELRRRMGGGLALLLGNGESPMNYAGNTYPFRQDSTMLYYFGADYPGACAVVDADNGRDIIFADDLTIDDIVWMGSLPSVAERASWVGVTDTRPMAALADYLVGRQVQYLPPYRAEHVATLRALGVAGDPSVPLIMAVADMRNHKTDEEIEQIEWAVDVTVDMHVRAMQVVRPGITEAEVASHVAQVALSHGTQMSFPIIGTVNGHTLHNYDRSHTLRQGQMFLLDAGAESPLHYAGDLSSTIPVGEAFTERQSAVFDILLAAHRAATAALRPGVNFRDVHLLAATRICEGLKGLDLIKGDPAECAHSGAYALFFPCGLGHMMGLDVHDMECLGEKYVGYGGRDKSTQFGFKSLRLGRELEPGFVLTIEPGIYFIPELMDLWRAENRFRGMYKWSEIEKWRDFTGLRNEEDWLITPTGARRLGSKAKPMTRTEIEAIKLGA